MPASLGHVGAQSVVEGAGVPEAGGVPVTTLMIKNVPRKHTPCTLLSEMETLWGKGVVNFVYVPCSAIEPGNMGIAFVNFISPDAMEHALAALSGKKWPSLRSSRPIKVAAAFVQGLVENIAYCAHKVPADVQHEHLPLVWHEGEKVDFRSAVHLYGQPGETVRHGRMQQGPTQRQQVWRQGTHAPALAHAHLQQRPSAQPWSYVASESLAAPREPLAMEEGYAGRLGPFVGVADGPSSVPGAALPQASAELWAAPGFSSPAGSWGSPSVCPPPHGVLTAAYEPWRPCANDGARVEGVPTSEYKLHAHSSRGEGILTSEYTPRPQKQQAPGNRPRRLPPTPTALDIDATSSTTAGSSGDQLADLKQSSSYQDACRDMAAKLRLLMFLVQTPALSF